MGDSQKTKSMQVNRWVGLGSFGLSLLAAGAEAAIVYGRYIYNLPYYWLFAGHLAVLLLLCGWIIMVVRRGGDASNALLTTLATAAMGPLGALVGAVTGLTTRTRGETTPLLREWYDRISHSVRVDPVTKHCDMVAIGRALDLAGRAPPSFSEAIDKGTLLQKQNALGLIARKFHPGYLSALKAALKSDEPVIRVQAAAVAAHVREDVKVLLHQHMDDVRACLSFADEAIGVPADAGGTASGKAKDPRIGLRLIDQIELCLGSGLLDEKDRTTGRQLVNDLGEVILDQLEAAGHSGVDVSRALESDLTIETIGLVDGRADERDPDELNMAPVFAEQLALDRARDTAALKLTYERLLLQRGLFDQFRARRMVHAGSVSGHWRVRRLREVHS